jgi:hypothetical protein
MTLSCTAQDIWSRSAFRRWKRTCRDAGTAKKDWINAPDRN